MTYECFEVEIDNNIAHIKMSRPEKRNAMNLAYWDELPAIVSDIDQNAKARVVVLSSTGPHFTGGLDINAFFNAAMSSDVDERTKRITNGADFYERVGLMQASFTALEECRIPVLAAIQGGCIGGGVDLVTACDMRYATEDAFFSVEEINIGMTADVGTFPRLTKLIPDGVARELCFTGNPMPADIAQGVGLVNRVYSDQQAMLDDVMKIAAQIASKAPLAMRGCKRMINYSRDHSVADTLDYVAIWNASHFQPEEIMEAVAARGEKRAGKFVDLPKKRSKLS